MSGEFKEIGARVKQARKARQMSQADLAEKLNISVSHMSDIETGKSNFGVDILKRITEALQVSSDELLRPDIPAVNAIYATEILELLDGCTPAEKDALVNTVRNMKAAFRSRL